MKKLTLKPGPKLEAKGHIRERADIQQMTDSRFVLVGIDPGVTCGVAMRQQGRREGRPWTEHTAQTLTLSGCFAYLEAIHSHVDGVYLEWPQYSKRIHRKAEGEPVGVTAAKGRTVGVNMGIAEALYAYLQHLKVPTVRVDPRSRPDKLPRQVATGLGIRCSQHAADALWMVYDRTPARLQLDLQREKSMA